MNSSRVAIRYAKGLFKFAQEQGVSDVLYTDSKKFIKILKETDSLAELIQNPSITPVQKVDVFRKVLSDSIHPYFFDFLVTIVKKGRFDYLINSLLLFEDIYRSENGIVEVQIESASELSETELKGIESAVNRHFNKQTEITLTVKPQLIAGFILIVEGKIMDYSVSGQLSQIKKSFGLTLS